MPPDTKNISSSAKDKHWKITLFVIVTAQILSGIGFSFVLPFFPFYFRDLGVVAEKSNLLWVGWSSAAFGIAMAVTAPIWGIFADRYGRKIMVVRSMFFGSIVLGLMGFAKEPWHLLALRVLQGITTGTVSASITLVSSVAPAASLGFSLGILQTANFLGQSIGPFVGGIISDHYGFRIPCFIASISLFIGTIFVVFGAIEKFARPEDKPVNGLVHIKDIISSRGFKAILASYFLIYVVNFMVFPILPLFIEDLAGTTTGSASLTGIFVAVTGLLAGISSVIFGKLGDRLGHKRIVVGSLLAAGCVSFPQSFANSLTVLFIERCLLGFAIGGVLPSLQTLVTQTVAKEKVGGAFGLTSSVTTLGIGAGPLIGGYLASIMGLRIPFAFMGLFALINAVFINKMIEVKDKRS